jgi:aminoglycoside phosphotransferase (APT) family kinase protein
MERQGVRSAWGDVPPTVRTAVDDAVGCPVVGTTTVAGGFSPGPAVRAVLRDGRSVFLKAACTSMNEESVRMHRRERDVLAALPTFVPAPALLGCVDDGHWIVLAVEWIDGHTPDAASAADVHRVLGLLQLLVECTGGVQIDGTGTVGQTHADLFGHWARLAAELPDGLDAWTRRHLDRLVELDDHALAATAGDHLVHLDVRTDNVVLGALGARDDVLVDWPGAAIGAPWIDLVSMLPALHLDGGPPPEEVLRSTRFAQPTWSDTIDAFLVALAGYFTRNSLEPAPPGLPTLRPFQAAQGVVTRQWIGGRLGLR